MNILQTIKAFFCKHESEPFFTEHENWVHTSRCKKCETELGMPKFKNYNCPPPFMTVEKWNEWVDDNIAELEMSIVAKRIELGLE